VLTRINIPDLTQNIGDRYFNNSGLLDIAKYSKNKYIGVPNDASLTNFYTLEYDNNFNIKPVISN
jgi:hypothetical protein